MVRRCLAGGGGDRNRASVDLFPARHLHGPGVVPRREPHRGAGGEEGAVLVPGHRRPLPPRPGGRARRTRPDVVLRHRLPLPAVLVRGRLAALLRASGARRAPPLVRASRRGRRHPGDEPRRGVREPLGERRSGTLRLRALILHRRRRALHGLGGGRPGGAADLAIPGAVPGLGRSARPARDLLPDLRRPLRPGLPLPPGGGGRGRRLPGARPGPRRRHEFLPRGPQPHRAVPRLAGLRGARGELPGRLRLRAGVPGSRRRGLAERTGPRSRDRRPTGCGQSPT